MFYLILCALFIDEKKKFQTRVPFILDVKSGQPTFHIVFFRGLENVLWENITFETILTFPTWTGRDSIDIARTDSGGFL